MTILGYAAAVIVGAGLWMMANAIDQAHEWGSHFRRYLIGLVMVIGGVIMFILTLKLNGGA